MKNLKILFVLLIFSLQAGATGYSQNMFVAQKKLSESKAPRSVRSVEKAKKQDVTAMGEEEPRDFYKKEVKAVGRSVSQMLSGWILKLVCKDLS